MLSKTYFSTWLSLDSVCGMGDLGVAQCPSAVLCLTLTSSCNDFLSIVYLYLYTPKT